MQPLEAWPKPRLRLGLIQILVIAIMTMIELQNRPIWEPIPLIVDLNVEALNPRAAAEKMQTNQAAKLRMIRHE